MNDCNTCPCFIGSEDCKKFIANCKCLRQVKPLYLHPLFNKGKETKGKQISLFIPLENENR